jgi:hypothetical protein
MRTVLEYLHTYLGERKSAWEAQTHDPVKCIVFEAEGPR